MTYEAFLESLQNDTAPQGLHTLALALWYDKKGDWDKAHQLADSVKNASGAWVHAYLHRVEGDIWNADYWYRLAKRPRPHISLEEEWEDLVKELL